MFMEVYADTPVEQILILKEHIYEIFNLSISKKEAYEKRDKLNTETWWRNSWHFTKVIQFLMRPDFENMVLYLANHRVPRCGNIETLQYRLWQARQSHSAKNRDCFGSKYGRTLAMTLF